MTFRKRSLRPATVTFVRGCDNDIYLNDYLLYDDSKKGVGEAPKILTASFLRNKWTAPYLCQSINHIIVKEGKNNFQASEGFLVSDPPYMRFYMKNKGGHLGRGVIYKVLL